MQSQLLEWRPPPFAACVAPCISRGSSWRRPCGMYSRSDVFGQRPCHPSVDATCETPMGAAGCMSGRGQKTTYLVHSSSCLMSIEKMGRGTEGQCTYTEGNDTELHISRVSLNGIEGSPKEWSRQGDWNFELSALHGHPGERLWW